MYALTPDPIDAASVRAAVEDPRFGAILIFEGVGRNSFEGRAVDALEYEAYAPMAIAELQKIGTEAAERWDAKVAIVHRIGRVEIGDPSVVIAVGTPHRAACYEANRYVIDELKIRVPIWKKEIYSDGHTWKANPTTP